MNAGYLHLSPSMKDLSLTIEHEQSKEDAETVLINYSVARNELTGDVSLDCDLEFFDLGYYADYDFEGQVDSLASQGDEGRVKLLAGRNSESNLGADSLKWSEMRTLYGEEEPLVAEMVLEFEMQATFDVAVDSSSAAVSALDSLGAFVDSRQPNDVAFILSSAPLRPLFSNQSILAAASPYFRNYFDSGAVLPRARRASEAIKRTASFVDDSDAESDDDDDDDLEMLVPVNELGSQRSKRRKSSDTEDDGDESGTAEEHEPKREEEEAERIDAKRSPKKGGEKRKKSSSGSAKSSPKKVIKSENAVNEIHVDDGSYNTMRAILVYLLSGHIEFA